MGDKSKKAPFKYQKTHLHSFVINEIDLKSLFRKAGNPEVIKLVTMSDTHVDGRPNRGHDPKALAVFKKFIKFYKPDVFMFGGDFADMGPISHWGSEDLDPRRLVPQMLKCREIIDELKRATPTTKHWLFLEGNHEDWLRQFLLEGNNPSLFDGIEKLGVELSVESLLGLKQRGIQFFKLNEFVRIGKANFTHGLYVGSGHAKKHLDRLKANIFYFHLHDTINHEDSSMEGPLEAQSLGCLCRLDAPFLRGKPNNWSQAIATFEFRPNGHFTKTVNHIINGVMSYHGKLFKA